MNKGSYRIYFKLPFINVGLKLPRYNINNGIPFVAFLGGIIMNINERERYKYYVLKKSKKQWRNIWKTTLIDKIKICPTYFSLFGLINIVEHVTICTNEKEDVLLSNEETAYLCMHDMKLENIGITKNGKKVLIDYGDFKVGGFNHTLLGLIDYK